MFRDQPAALGEKARFAIAENRDDLAEAALSWQIDFEAQAERLDAGQAEAADEAGGGGAGRRGAPRPGTATAWRRVPCPGKSTSGRKRSAGAGCRPRPRARRAGW